MSAAVLAQCAAGVASALRIVVDLLQPEPVAVAIRS